MFLEKVRAAALAGGTVEKMVGRKFCAKKKTTPKGCLQTKLKYFTH